jgi:hypothetical protein
VTKARLWAPAESCSRKQCWFEYPNDGLCDQSIRADRTKVSAGQTLVSINNLTLRPRKRRQMLIFFRQPRDNARKITIVLWLYSSNKVSQKNWWYDRSLWNDQRGLEGKTNEMKF